jgi:hypothetical protein
VVEGTTAQIILGEEWECSDVDQQLLLLMQEIFLPQAQQQAAVTTLWLTKRSEGLGTRQTPSCKAISLNIGKLLILTPKSRTEDKYQSLRR